MSSRLELVKGFFKAFESRDSKELEPFLAKSFKAQILPATLKHPEYDREGYLKLISTVFGNLEKAKFEILDTVEGKDAIVLHIKGLSTFKDGTPFSNEYVFILWFDENDKVVNVKEFMDSAYVESVRSKLYLS